MDHAYARLEKLRRKVSLRNGIDIDKPRWGERETKEGWTRDYALGKLLREHEQREKEAR